MENSVVAPAVALSLGLSSFQAQAGGKDDDGHRSACSELPSHAELSEALRSSLAVDAGRFIEFLNTDSEDGLYESIIDRADALDARLDELAGQIPHAWSEPFEDYEIVTPAPERPVKIEITEDTTVIELEVESPALSEPPVTSATVDDVP